MLHVSTVICTRNRPDLIGNAVASVLANTYPSFDLVVVDQSDDDQSGLVVRALTEKHPQLRYVHTSTAGLSRAYNIGIRASRGELLAFTDDDCVAPPDWVANVVAAFAAEPAGELLYGQVLVPPGLVKDGGIVPSFEIDKPRRLTWRQGFRVCGMGANFAARRSLFDRVGGFDEALGGGGPLKSSQDFDFIYRTYVAGATVLLRPEVKVDHYGLRQPEQWGATMRAYGFGDGAFYWKHVRCGDPVALWLLGYRLGRLTVREALIVLGIRRRGSFAIYMRAVLEGIRASVRHPIDRAHRLYRALPAAA